jgi:peroxiredoxin Q/BCP
MTNPGPAVKAGDSAPPFSTLDDSGKRVSLADFKGQWVVLYWYPKDDTPG